MGKYFYHLKLHIERHLTYRARVFIWVFVDTVPVFIFPFLWLSLYGDATTLGGFTRSDIVTYYLVSTLVWTASSSHISRLIRDDIMRGLLSEFQIKPINYLFLRPLRELSYKILLLIIVVPVGILFYFLFPEYLLLPTAAITWFLFFISLFLGYLFSTLVQMIIGFGAFWLGETNTGEQLDYIVSQLFAGRLAPLSFLPGLLGQAAMILPYRFVVYVPTQIYLGKVSFAELQHEYIQMVIWILVLLFLVLLLWKRGLKNYEGVGI